MPPSQHITITINGSATILDDPLIPAGQILMLAHSQPGHLPFRRMESQNLVLVPAGSVVYVSDGDEFLTQPKAAISTTDATLQSVCDVLADAGCCPWLAQDSLLVPIRTAHNDAVAISVAREGIRFTSSRLLPSDTLPFEALSVCNALNLRTRSLTAALTAGPRGEPVLLISGDVDLPGRHPDPQFKESIDGQLAAVTRAWAITDKGAHSAGMAPLGAPPLMPAAGWRRSALTRPPSPWSCAPVADAVPSSRTRRRTPPGSRGSGRQTRQVPAVGVGGPP